MFDSNVMIGIMLIALAFYYLEGWTKWEAPPEQAPPEKPKS